MAVNNIPAKHIRHQMKMIIGVKNVASIVKQTQWFAGCIHRKLGVYTQVGAYVYLYF